MKIVVGRGKKARNFVAPTLLGLFFCVWGPHPLWCGLKRGPPRASTGQFWPELVFSCFGRLWPNLFLVFWPNFLNPKNPKDLNPKDLNPTPQKGPPRTSSQVEGPRGPRAPPRKPRGGGRGVQLFPLNHVFTMTILFVPPLSLSPCLFFFVFFFPFFLIFLVLCGLAKRTEAPILALGQVGHPNFGRSRSIKGLAKVGHSGLDFVFLGGFSCRFFDPRFVEHYEVSLCVFSCRPPHYRCRPWVTPLACVVHVAPAWFLEVHGGDSLEGVPPWVFCLFSCGVFLWG